MNILKKETKQAFEYEANCDYLNAIRCYESALEKDWSVRQSDSATEERINRRSR